MDMKTEKSWHLFVPKLIVALREGYSFRIFGYDLAAGVTVAIVALPLAMALAIASGATPDKGLITAIVAGFFISALGGSRFQIGGPTGAFVVVVSSVIAHHGYDGMVLATLMAGLLLILAGLLRLGTWIKYIPEPVIAGFTSGIAVIIFSSQIRDLLGLQMKEVPSDFLPKWAAFWQARDSINNWALILAAVSLGFILVLRRYAPRWPGFLLVVILASAATLLFQLPVETIGSRFGGIPNQLPLPRLPEITWQRMMDLFPSAFTIAFLAGVESLLCAIVADGMTGRHHKSNCELVAQGVANIASAGFAGLPATGALARTATNIKAGARTPVAGILHALILLGFILFFSPLARFIPLASLAAILVIVAWNMSEVQKFRALIKAPLGDSLVLLTTFALTILVDLTVAIEAGIVLGSILFMHRMAEIVSIRQGRDILFAEDQDDFVKARLPGPDQRADLPKGVEVFHIEGPLFFGVANRLGEMLDHLGTAPHILILRMRDVPLIDSSGIAILRSLIQRCHRQGIKLVLSGLQAEPARSLAKAGIKPESDTYETVENFNAALERARIHTKK